jgi:WD40 repeat protein
MKPQWQKAVLVLTVGGVSLTGMSIPAMAATKPVAVEAKIVVDGQSFSVRTIQVKGVELVSVRDLARSFGIVPDYAASSITLNTEATVRLTVGSLAYTVNGENKAFAVAPLEIGGAVYVERNAVVEALGGSIEGQGKEAVIHSFKLLDGSYSSLRWISDNRILAVRQDDKSVYVIDPANKKGDRLTSDQDATDLVVSPDGKSGVYATSTGTLKVINLQTGLIRTVSTDTTVKTDLVWSPDGASVYFVQGDNQEKLSVLQLNTGSITNLLNDKVNYKSELRVSADAKRLLYIVNVTGVATNDSNSTEESLTIDYSKAGSQLLQLALDTKDAKPVVLASGKTNKLYPQILKDGTAAYIRTDPDAANPVGSLQLVSAPDKAVAAAADLDAEEATLTPTGELVVTGLDKSGQSQIVLVQPDGSTKKLAASTDISGVVSSADGRLVALNGGKVVLVSATGLDALTR